MDAEMQVEMIELIELIERENGGACIARVFGVPSRYPMSREAIFVSTPRPSRQEAIDDAEKWAIQEVGRELPVSTAVEVLPYSKPNLGREQRSARRGHDPSYGITKPLPTKTNWSLPE